MDNSTGIEEAAAAAAAAAAAVELKAAEELTGLLRRSKFAPGGSLNAKLPAATRGAVGKILAAAPAAAQPKPAAAKLAVAKPKHRPAVTAPRPKSVTKTKPSRPAAAAPSSTPSLASSSSSSSSSSSVDQEAELAALTNKMAKGVKLRLDPEEFTDDERALYAERLEGEIITRH